MEYVVTFIAGAAAAASALVIWYFAYVTLLRQERTAVKLLGDRLNTDSAGLSQQRNAFEDWKREEIAALDRRKQQEVSDLDNWKRRENERVAAQVHDIKSERQNLDEGVAAFEARKVRYEELLRENGFLKQDLFNLSVKLKKTERDHAAIDRRQEEISQRTNDLADRYLKENVTWIAAKVTPRNFSSCKDRLLKVVEACRGIGFDVPVQTEQSLVEDLRKEFEESVRQEFVREEQARIRAQIREEEKLARETEKLIQEAERQKAAVQAALEKALREAKDEHSAEVDLLRAKLREAEEKAQRAISQAQKTKAGHVYVLSNIGSFGEGVVKIGMTRRLEPERVNRFETTAVRN